MKQNNISSVVTQPALALWQMRHFIGGSVAREFQSRYANSLLGSVWPFLQPAAMILIYTVIFSRLMQAKIPGAQGEANYSIYLCAGLISWNFLVEVLTRFSGMFIENANLVKKTSFPWACLPLIAVTSSVLNHLIMASILLVVVLCLGGVPWPVFLGMVPLLVLLAFFASGLGLVLSIVNVFFRDVSQVLPLGLQLWFWLTPVVYPLSVLPEYARRLVELNPMVPIVQAYQSILTLGAHPDYATLLYPLSLGVVFWILALRMAKNLLPHVVDEL